MADDSVAAKREARRRRILQNSQARLEKITGRPTNGTQVKLVSTNEYLNGPIDLVEDDDDYSQPTTSTSADVGDNLYCSREDNSDDEYSIYGNNSTELYSKYSQGDTLETADGHANTPITNPGASPEETRELQIKPPKKIHLITYLKIHLLLLAILVRLFYYFDLGFVFGESIFVPFVVVEASHLLVLELSKSESAESTGIIGAVMLLGGISPERVHRFMKIFNLASRIGETSVGGYIRVNKFATLQNIDSMPAMSWEVTSLGDIIGEGWRKVHIMSKAVGRLKSLKKTVEKAKLSNKIRATIPAGMAAPGPPLGPVLGQHGINIAAFCKDFNERTKDMIEGVPLPCRISVNPDRSYEIIMYKPPTTFFLKQAAGIQRGAMYPGREMSGKITLKHLYEIAKIKSEDPTMELLTLEQICQMMVGTARTCGIEIVRDLDPKEYAQFLEDRKQIVAEQKKELEEKKEAKMLRTG
ncbi:39S ribosomal protein L11, mitochondrial [Gryllus bimaculatus]|nr:39S ribosomal protein L11, mitochondrial [Gryllus bimaculatus]